MTAALFGARSMTAPLRRVLVRPPHATDAARWREYGWRAERVEVLMTGPTSSGMSNERIAFVRARGLTRVGDGGGVGSEDITVHAVPRQDAAAWLVQKSREGYELDLKLWAGLWMIEHNPDGSRADEGPLIL